LILSIAVGRPIGDIFPFIANPNPISATFGPHRPSPWQLRNLALLLATASRELQRKIDRRLDRNNEFPQLKSSSISRTIYLLLQVCAYITS
jgi:hypothetical protein